MRLCARGMSRACLLLSFLVSNLLNEPVFLNANFLSDCAFSSTQEISLIFAQNLFAISRLSTSLGRLAATSSLIVSVYPPEEKVSSLSQMHLMLFRLLICLSCLAPTFSLLAHVSTQNEGVKYACNELASQEAHAQATVRWCEKSFRDRGIERLIALSWIEGTSNCFSRVIDVPCSFKFLISIPQR